MAFHADRIDALLRTLAVRQLLEPLDDAFVSKLMVMAPPASAMLSRSGMQSMATTCLAPSRMALRIAIWPTGPAAPDRDGVGGLDVALDGGLPAGREDVAEEQHLLVREAVRNLDVRGIRKRNAEIFRLAAGIAAGQMRVAEQAGGGVAEHLVAQAACLRLVVSHTEKLPRLH